MVTLPFESEPLAIGVLFSEDVFCLALDDGCAAPSADRFDRLSIRFL